jgi:hypothetical protein
VGTIFSDIRKNQKVNLGLAVFGVTPEALNAIDNDVPEISKNSGHRAVE